MARVVDVLDDLFGLPMTSSAVGVLEGRRYVGHTAPPSGEPCGCGRCSFRTRRYRMLSIVHNVLQQLRLSLATFIVQTRTHNKCMMYVLYFCVSPCPTPNITQELVWHPYYTVLYSYYNYTIVIL